MKTFMNAPGVERLPVTTFFIVTFSAHKFCSEDKFSPVKA